MSVELNNGKIRISVGYGLKVPTNEPYAMEDGHFATSMEFDIEGDVEVALAQARQLESTMFRELQLSTFSYLGIEDFNEQPNGRLVPKIPPAPEKPKKSGGNWSGGYKPSGGGSGGGQQARKANPADIPQHTVVVNGQSITVQDLRGLKANGTYAANAPDFREGERGIWLKTKQGGQNPEAEAIVAAISTTADAEAPW